MTVYVPAPAAQPLSNALWAMARPSEVRSVADTQYLFGWIDDTTGNRWLVVETDYEIPVHPLAELNGIADIIRPWIDAGNLPADTNATLAALIESKRGGRLVPWQAFPQFFKDQAKTYAQMIAAGLLQNPAMP